MGTLHLVEGHLHQRYGSKEGAYAYRHKYERSLFRRLSNRREMAIVDAGLTQAKAQGHVLDCPCGAGRLVPTILRHAEHVTAVDLSEAMVREAEDALGAAVRDGRVEFAVAPVEELPFDADAFDTVVCHRLIHHVADAEQRARVFAELARVARRRVVMSFGDAGTFKHWLQTQRGKRRRRVAMRVDALREEAAAEGLVLEPPVHRLNGLFSLVAVAVFVVAGDEGAAVA